MKQDSVKAFAEAINKRAGSLDILVNNAGLGYTKKSFTEQGVGMLTQVCCGCWRFVVYAVTQQ
jgi:NAD(P)-dependent dehydrogenase (short-subunit alcohol dehydrogenase family)